MELPLSVPSLSLPILSLLSLFGSALYILSSFRGTKHRCNRFLSRSPLVHSSFSAAITVSSRDRARFSAPQHSVPSPSARSTYPAGAGGGRTLSPLVPAVLNPVLDPPTTGDERYLIPSGDLDRPLSLSRKKKSNPLFLFVSLAGGRERKEGRGREARRRRSNFAGGECVRQLRRGMRLLLDRPGGEAEETHCELAFQFYLSPPSHSLTFLPSVQ